MKRFIVVFFVFLFALAGVSFSNAENNTTPTNAAIKTTLEQSSYTYDNFIYVRVLIDGHWWTYVYTSDGSFIVAIPDEED